MKNGSRHHHSDDSTVSRGNGGRLDGKHVQKNRIYVHSETYASWGVSSSHDRLRIPGARDPGFWRHDRDGAFVALARGGMALAQVKHGAIDRSRFLIDAEVL